MIPCSRCWIRSCEQLVEPPATVGAATHPVPNQERDQKVPGKKPPEPPRQRLPEANDGSCPVLRVQEESEGRARTWKTTEPPTNRITLSDRQHPMIRLGARIPMCTGLQEEAPRPQRPTLRMSQARSPALIGRKKSRSSRLRSRNINTIETANGGCGYTGRRLRQREPHQLCKHPICPKVDHRSDNRPVTARPKTSWTHTAHEPIPAPSWPRNQQTRRRRTAHPDPWRADPATRNIHHRAAFPVGILSAAGAS
jgi:hypothetical protein